MKSIYLKGIILMLSVVFVASCVKNEVKTITLNKAASNLILGEKDSLIATVDITGDIKKLPQTWTSTDPAIATVGNTGLVTGIAKGTTIITVKAGDKSATCQINVFDQVQPNFTQGQLWYYGDAYTTTKSNNFTVCLASSGINLSTLSGYGELAFLELNTSLSVTDSITTGTYEIANFPVANFIPNTIVPAWVASDGYPWGTWYFGASNCPIVAGNAVITVVKKVYSIQYNLLDNYGNTFSGTYQGTLEYFDNSKPSTAPTSIRSNIKAKMKNSLFTLKPLNR